MANLLRFGLLTLFAIAPLASAQANCWDKPCEPPVDCCICPCPNMIGAASLDDPSKKDRNRFLSPPAEELALSKDSVMPSEKALQALLSGKHLPDLR